MSKNRAKLRCKQKEYIEKKFPEDGQYAKHQKEWRQKHKKADKESHCKYHKNHREIWRAAKALKRAMLKGSIIRPSQCSDCLAENIPIIAHHENYKKPLEIIWLCVKCHRKRHRKVA